MDHALTLKLFEHCRLIVGMVLSLAVARLLNGIARFVQHPKRDKVFPIHLLWVFSLILFLVHFWWWEFKLIQVQVWNFESYFLLILYATLFFLLCALLFPDSMEEYSGFKDYFISRQKWFFCILALTFIVDFGDTWLKGDIYVYHLGIEYPIRNVVYVLLCLIAMFVKNKYFQYAFVIGSLAYELSYIFRLYHTQ